MKVLLMTSKERVKRYSDLSSLPKHWNLVFAEYELNTQKLLDMGGDADVIFVDAIQPVTEELINSMQI